SDEINDGYVPSPTDGVLNDEPVDTAIDMSNPDDPGNGKMPPGVIGGSTSAGIAGTWVRKLDATLAAEEYTLSTKTDQAGTWTAPNRGQGLRTQWKNGVLNIQPRTLGLGDWSLGFSLIAAGTHDAAAVKSCAPVPGVEIE